MNNQNNQSILDIKINSQSLSLKKMRIEEDQTNNHQYEDVNNDYYFESVIENHDENQVNNSQTDYSLYGTSDLKEILRINENIRMKNCLIYTSLVDDGLVDNDKIDDEMHENHDERLPFDDDYINYRHETSNLKKEALKLLKKQRESKKNDGFKES